MAGSRQLKAGQSVSQIRRTKTGCRTCKIRRIKCDETRPSCRRCVSTGRTCDGYGVWDADRGSHLPPQGLAQSRSLSRHNTPVVMAGINSEEKLLFEWFIYRTSKKMPGLFESPLWLTLIPQASSQQRAVLHSALALASAHKVITLKASTSIMTKGNVSEQDDSTLRQYNKAIQHILGSLSNDDRKSQRLALVTNVVFTCLEYVRRQYKTGFTHLKNGTRLLTSFYAQRSPDPNGNKTTLKSLDPVDAWLIEVFGQLNLQTQLLRFTPLSSRFPMSTFGVQGIPRIFTSAREARGYLDALFYDTYEFIEGCPQDGLPPQHPIVLNVASKRRKLLIKSKNWLKAYSASEKEAHIQVPNEQTMAFGLLSVYHTMAHIMIGSYMYPENEMTFDLFTGDFKSILKRLTDLLQLSHHVLKLHGGVGNNYKEFTFTSDLGLLPPLYYTLVKCRNSIIRNEAFAMLTSGSYREGIWDSQLIAIVTERIRKMEEPSLGGFSCPAGDSSVPPLVDEEQTSFSALPIPEFLRLRNVKVEFPDVPESRLILTYQKKYFDGTLMSLREEYDCCTASWFECGNFYPPK